MRARLPTQPLLVHRRHRLHRLHLRVVACAGLGRRLARGRGAHGSQSHHVVRKVQLRWHSDADTHQGDHWRRGVGPHIRAPSGCRRGAPVVLLVVHLLLRLGRMEHRNQLVRRKGLEAGPAGHRYHGYGAVYPGRRRCGGVDPNLFRSGQGRLGQDFPRADATVDEAPAVPRLPPRPRHRDPGCGSVPQDAALRQRRRQKSGLGHPFRGRSVLEDEGRCLEHGPPRFELRGEAHSQETPEVHRGLQRPTQRH
mmetsp:Transcript_56262/g.163076  ORF Transcript_56262/g.163076 Transcript_56262/m.163076 type:complete len:252 (+) Transcript_56262:1187-1942(+)